MFISKAWCRLGQIAFRRNERHRHLGSLLYCESSPQRLWVSKSRARDGRGQLGDLAFSQ